MTDKWHRTQEPPDTSFIDDCAKVVTCHSTKLIIQQARNIPLKRVYDLECNGEAPSLCGNSRRKLRKKDRRRAGRVPYTQYLLNITFKHASAN